MNALLKDTKASVKVIGANGQISLGKEYAGRQVLVEEREPGVWLVRTAIVVPENEQWLHLPRAAAELESALSWAARTRPQSTNIDKLFEGTKDGQRSTSQARKAGSQQSRVPKKSAPTR
jgi:hypothetical protein